MGKSKLSLASGSLDVRGIGLAVDASLLFSLQRHVALDPGAEVRGIKWNIIFPLARLDTAQAADTFFSVDAERPSVLAPIVVRNGRPRTTGRGRAGSRSGGIYRHRGRAAGDNAAEATQKIATLSLLLLELFFRLVLEVLLPVHFAVLLANLQFCRVSLASRV